jgi:Cation transporting ATPase, C-terminus
MHVIRDFMVFIGPISSIFDFLTFYVLLHYFHANERLFHTGWFVESLTTQTLVLFVIRTMGNPFRSRPSRSLIVTTLLIVGIGVALPVTPMAVLLGFTRLPALLFCVSDSRDPRVSRAGRRGQTAVRATIGIVSPCFPRHGPLRDPCKLRAARRVSALMFVPRHARSSGAICGRTR